MSKEITCVSIDFEAVESTWVTFAGVVATFPSGNILRTFEIGYKCDEIITGSLFWSKNTLAHSYNKQLCELGYTKETAEHKIVSFMDDILEKHTNFHIIADAPEYDLRFLNNILEAHKRPIISFRNDRYYQSVCTWSFRLALCKMHNVSANEFEAMYLRPRISCHVTSMYHKGYPKLKHTPLHDTLGTLSHYFQLLDFIERQKQKSRVQPVYFPFASVFTVPLAFSAVTTASQNSCVLEVSQSLHDLQKNE